ncbi:MAG: GNAT family N-acetyltransferase [Patescibacteria group bacterium]|nr:GNAT family N-acetyltransferase [Patescibacteria group bacterium]MDD5294988.1 GNAT family N-acetyltransferase [Patescibacteria group bacterium]MDD5554542.1 GNAT family N-acetyltransferase [Patescibacteria group bacterium]
MITIRKAKVKDLPKTAKLGAALLKHHKKFDKYFSPAEGIEKIYKKFFKKNIYSPKGLLLIAEEKGKIIGYALATIRKRPSVFKFRRIGNIDDVYIIPAYRRLRIAKQFLEKIFQWFKIKKIKDIEMQVHIKNEIGKAAWSKYGFKAFTERRRLKLK